MSDLQNYAEIAAVVATYVEGMCQNDPSKLCAAMHEKLACIGHFDNALEWDSRDEFISAIAAAVETPDPAPWHRINSITVVGDTATVQVEDIWLGMHFDDTLILLRHEGQWVIVSKVFHLRA